MKPKEHNDFIKLVCLLCLSKEKKGSPQFRLIKPREYCKMSIDYESIIKNHCWKEYNFRNNNLPKKLCPSCRRKLIGLEEKDPRYKPFSFLPKCESK